MNTKTGPLTKRHNSYPWEFQQTVGGPVLQQLHRYCLRNSSIFLISFMRTSYYVPINPRMMKRGTKRNQPWVSNDDEGCDYT
jgi:hypothetical protein